MVRPGIEINDAYSGQSQPFCEGAGRHGGEYSPSLLQDRGRQVQHAVLRSAEVSELIDKQYIHVALTAAKPRKGLATVRLMHQRAVAARLRHGAIERSRTPRLY